MELKSQASLFSGGVSLHLPCLFSLFTSSYSLTLSPGRYFAQQSLSVLCLGPEQA